MVRRSVVLSLALLAGCPGYSPEFVDCKLKCSDKGTCPAGKECKSGWCRPPMATNSCDCGPGDQRPCGGGVGLCNPGTQTCTSNGNWGSCLGEGKPTAEICDNKDNDCNGTVDDAVSDAPPCPLSKGECSGKVQKCVSGLYSGTCAVADYGMNYELVETRCDNLDNDCNGVVDGTAPAQLMTGVSDFALAEYDGGFSLVGIEEPLTGGYQVVLQRLDASLKKKGLPVPVSPPAQLPDGGLTALLVIAARSNPEGTTFIAWGNDAVDAGVQLSAVDLKGIVSQFTPYLASERTGPLSMGVSGTKVFVTWPAHFSNLARLVMWDLTDGGLATRDYLTTDDGGINSAVTVDVTRLSPTGKVLAMNSAVKTMNADGGAPSTTYSTLVVEPLGTRTSGAYLNDRFRLTEVGPLVQAGWSYSQPPFLFIIPEESGFVFKNDVFASATASFVKQSDQDIKGGTTGRGNNASVVTWTNKYLTATIATPYGNGAQARQRALTVSNTFFGEMAVGHPGGPGGLIGLVWRDTVSGVGNLTGMMVCQP